MHLPTVLSSVIITEMGLVGAITANQAAKKWENLKKKYRDLILAKTEDGEVKAANWPFYEAMHRALGPRDSSRPFNIIASAMDWSEEAPYEGPDEGLDEGPDEGPSSSAPGPDEDPGSPAPGQSHSGGKKPRKRKNEVLTFLLDYGDRQEKRLRELDEKEEEREKRRDEQLSRLIDIFGKMVDKM
ncbi:uncharacterized protein LOC133456248 isoform X2 [Cololabis saira]|uniref:uncharacterized protein LOC133456248 isoform X2 n=1 Tax=Cololabis saira TaxID=129043 RepID=UPI002AD42B78|nr:uncharacterized protein LOC133456248 isoform X2 [Cololabis saira]